MQFEEKIRHPRKSYAIHYPIHQEIICKREGFKVEKAELGSGSKQREETALTIHSMSVHRLP